MFESIKWQQTKYPSVLENESELYHFFQNNHNNQIAKVIREEIKELEQPAFLLHHVLSPEECKALIDATEKIGYETADKYCHAYRDRYNDRLMSDDLLFTQLIWERCKQFLPNTASPPGQSTIWNLDSLNSRWRYCKYTESHYFGGHTDGIFKPSANKTTIFTFMLYLNGQEKNNVELPTYTGGCTNFLKYDKNEFWSGRKQHQLVKRIVPEPGLAIVFPQQSLPHYHEGEALVSGTKYILRSDIFYTLPESNIV